MFHMGTVLMPMLFLVFDDEDENKLSYTDIHMQYKTLVSAIGGTDVSKLKVRKRPFVMHVFINITSVVLRC